jgi:hypothetical protein
LQSIALVVGDSSFDHHEPALATLNSAQLRSLTHLRESLTGIERDLKALLGMKHVGILLFAPLFLY